MVKSINVHLQFWLAQSQCRKESCYFAESPDGPFQSHFAQDRMIAQRLCQAEEADEQESTGAIYGYPGRGSFTPCMRSVG